MAGPIPSTDRMCARRYRGTFMFSVAVGACARVEGVTVYLASVASEAEGLRFQTLRRRDAVRAAASGRRASAERVHREQVPSLCV
jgi:hypothetical protein